MLCVTNVENENLVELFTDRFYSNHQHSQLNKSQFILYDERRTNLIDV